MSNIKADITAINSVIELERFQDHSLCIITTNGVFVGTLVRNDQLGGPYLDPGKITEFAHSLAVEANEKKVNATAALNQTILLENVKYSVGRLLHETNNVIINISQIVAVQAIRPHEVINYLEKLSYPST